MIHAFNLFFIMIALSFTNEGIYLKREKKSPLCGEISFTTIAAENYSGVSKKKTLIITNQKDFEKTWSECYSIQIPQPKAPQINFEKEIVLVAFAGEFSSGGYKVELTNINKKRKTINVNVINTTPGANCNVTSAMTQPFHMIKMNTPKKSIKEIKFIDIAEATHCE
jgi:hypothetical protein